MAANGRRSKRAQRDVYREITERILEALEAGTVPWRRPWRDFGMQRNLSSGRPYRGVNQLLTQLTQQSPRLRLAVLAHLPRRAARGGNVRRGERGSLVVLWKRLLIEDEESGERKTVWWVRPYTVFNLDQVDGVEPPPIEDELLEFEPIERCEAVLAAMPDPPSVEHRPGGAFYLPATDTITLPPTESFHDEEGYYATRFHETVHSTGHASRLDRELAPRSHEEAYSREELIAELGAAMLCGIAGIAPVRIEQSAAYIASWLRALTRRQADGGLGIPAGPARRRPHPQRDAPGRWRGRAGSRVGSRDGIRLTPLRICSAGRPGAPIVVLRGARGSRKRPDGGTACAVLLPGNGRRRGGPRKGRSDARASRHRRLRERVREVRAVQSGLLALRRDTVPALLLGRGAMRRDPVPGLLERLRREGTGGELFRLDPRVTALRRAEEMVVDQLDREELQTRLTRGPADRAHVRLLAAAPPQGGTEDQRPAALARGVLGGRRRLAAERSVKPVSPAATRSRDRRARAARAPALRQAASVASQRPSLTCSQVAEAPSADLPSPKHRRRCRQGREAPDPGVG